MSKKPDHKLFAIVSDQGTAMSETVLTEAEYDNPAVRASTEERAAKIADCSKPIQWKDVTNNEAFWEDEPCKCDNCGHECDADELREPPAAHLWERLDAGSIVPAGECPKCGAFSYLIPKDDYMPDYHKLTREQRAAYLKHKGKCPHCQSTDIEGTGEHEADDDWYQNEIKCNACGALWNDVYTITDVQGVEEPDPANVEEPEDEDDEEEVA